MSLLKPSAGERGAILVHVALGILAFMAFSTFVIDYGLFWQSRRQSQNAADAGALAGAITSQQGGLQADIESIAHDVAVLNRVWGSAPAAETALIDCPDTAAVDVSCIRVRVFRDTAHNNRLPMIVGGLFGNNFQDVRAEAIARVASGNASDCLKPLAVPDRFTDVDGDGMWSPGDIYVPPTDPEYTGYDLDDVGTRIHLEDAAGHSNPEIPTLDNGWFRLIDLFGGAGGGVGGSTGTRAQFMSCVADVYEIGDAIPQQMGEAGGADQGVYDLYMLDPGASWDDTDERIEGGCVEDLSCEKYVFDGPGQPNLVPDRSVSLSPRVMALPLFNPQKFAEEGVLEIVNIFGFFLETEDFSEPRNAQDFRDSIWGRLVSKPALSVAGGAVLDENAAFLTVVQLIR